MCLRVTPRWGIWFLKINNPFGLSLSKPVLIKDEGPFDKLKASGNLGENYEQYH